MHILVITASRFYLGRDYRLAAGFNNATNFMINVDNVSCVYSVYSKCLLEYMSTL